MAGDEWDGRAGFALTKFNRKYHLERVLAIALTLRSVDFEKV